MTLRPTIRARLTAAQQLLLCTHLARGKDSKGHPYTKSNFRREAQRCGAINALQAQVHVRRWW
jgi:hypothetical protein